jgi:hypothetical protein
MGLASLLSFATMLSKKLRSAPHDVRTLILACIDEVRETGLIPLGLRSDDGGPAYVWLLFDRSRLTLEERERYVRAKTPPGVRTRTIEI